MATNVSIDINAELAKIHKDRTYTDLATTIFNHRYPIENPLITGYNYIFFTCPRLSLIESQFNTSNIGELSSDYYKNNSRQLGLPLNDNDSIYDKNIITALAGGGGLYKFIPLLTNCAVKYSATDEKLDTMDYAETWNKFKIVIGTSNQDSRLAGTFQIEYMEDDELHIMKLHKLWCNYIEKVFLGDVVSIAALKAIGTDGAGAFSTGVIDYMTSMYHFSTLPDGKTLQYWCKYTGVFPTTNPFSNFTSDDGTSNISSSVPIEYQYSFKEEMKIHILEDFNIVSSNNSKRYDPKDTDVNYFEHSSVKLREIAEYPRIIKTPITDTKAFNRHNSFQLDFGNEDE
jgi:hypothetical protein